MRLSLSVRIAEGFLSKEEAVMGLDEVCRLARLAGVDALCMRASQVGVHSTREEVLEARRVLREQEMAVSMVTGDFATVYNNASGPDSLRNITPYLDLAEAMGAPMVRVALKTAEDVEAARGAADEAAERGLVLVHQCHVQSLFETVEGIEETLRAIGRSNFGLVYEPANLEECGQDYGEETVRRLGPWIRNVYLQNQRIHPEGAITLDTWCRGPVSFDLLPVECEGGVDFASVFRGLRAIGYEGMVTLHQSGPTEGDALEPAMRAAEYLRGLMRGNRSG